MERRATPGVVLRSAVQSTIFVVSILIWGLLSLLSFPLPHRYRYWFVTRWTHFNLRVLELVCGLRCHVEGLEHIPQGQGGIIMCKHQSTWETLALQRWFTPQTWVLKRELMRVPAFGWAIGLLDPIAIDRSARAEAVKQLVDQGRERIGRGIWVVVFPEGTRVAAGTRGKYRIGGAVLAEKTGVPVVPVAHNAGEYWARNRLLKWPGIIQVRIGPAIATEGRTAAAIMAEVEGWIEGRMAEISTLSPDEKGA